MNKYMSYEFYEYRCVLELANQCENKMDTPIRIIYCPTGDNLISSRHFLHYNSETDKYDIMGKLRNVEYVKSEQSYVVNFELVSVICSGSHIYDQDFLFDKSR